MTACRLSVAGCGTHQQFQLNAANTCITPTPIATRTSSQYPSFRTDIGQTSCNKQMTVAHSVWNGMRRPASASASTNSIRTHLTPSDDAKQSDSTFQGTEVTEPGLTQLVTFHYTNGLVQIHPPPPLRHIHTALSTMRMRSTITTFPDRLH